MTKEWTPDPGYIEHHNRLSTRELEQAVALLERDVSNHRGSNCSPRRLMFLEGCYQAIKELYEQRIQ